MASPRFLTILISSGQGWPSMHHEPSSRNTSVQTYRVGYIFLSGWISSYRIIWTPISSCWPRPSDASQLSVGGSPPDFHICAFLVFHCAAKSGTKRRRGQRLCPFLFEIICCALLLFRVSHVTLKVQNRKQKKRTTGGARYCPGFISQFRRGRSSAQLALQLP